MKKAMPKTKPIVLNFRPKSAKELAVSLGIPEERYRRLVEIAEKITGKPYVPNGHLDHKKSRSVAVKSKHSGQRTHATSSKTAKARH
ncbi:MAG: hypothetical protein ACRD3E_05395 [Terriglobales bacterium]